MKRLLSALALTLTLAAGAEAMAPEERLADPRLEQRARDLSAELRCVVCQNQSIDDSDAGIARDLRRTVREQIVAGSTDREIRDMLVARYGEFVLLKPRWTAGTIVLWLAPLLLLAGALAWIISSRRAGPAGATPLSAEEEKRLAGMR